MTFSTHLTTDANATPTESGWRLQIPAGDAKTYRVAQLDDYSVLPRRRFIHNTPTTLRLRARASNPTLPGTWGFGLWNDPFALSLGLGGAGRRLPALPNAAWFFCASEQNYLSFRDDKPASGFLAATFRAPRIPSALLVSGILGAPLLLSRRLSKWLRAIGSEIVREDGLRLGLDVTQWHEYGLVWGLNRVEFIVDGQQAFETGISPRGPLGVVLWIDNQFAAFTPAGKIGLGVLETKTLAWLDVQNIEIS